MCGLVWSGEGSPGPQTAARLGGQNEHFGEMAPLFSHFFCEGKISNLTVMLLAFVPISPPFHHI